MNCNTTLRTFISALIISSPACLVAAPVDDVKALAQSGRAGDAYALGKQHPEGLGDPVFDFFFGIAAIDTGNAGDGVLALERYILVFPDNTSARLQLARGYFILGEDSRAREEFEEIRKLNPPTDVAATLDRYLDAIRLRETRYTASSGGYVEWGIGSDSNANSGVSNANISLPNLGPVIVGPGGTQSGDTFHHLGAGGYVSYPVLPGVAVYANGTAESRFNGSNAPLDQGNYSGSAGASLLMEKELFRFGLNHSLIYISNARFRSSTGISGEWQHQLDQQQAFTLNVQTGRLTYPGLNTPHDANFIGITGGYRKLFTHAWQPILSASVNLGREDAIAFGREDLSRHYTGWRLGVSFTPAAKWGVAAGYTAQQSNYQAPDAFLGVARRDDYGAIDTAITYLVNRNLSVRGETLFSKNRSNISLFSFPRDIFAIKLRYEFK